MELEYGMDAFKTLFPNFQLLNENTPVPDEGRTGIVMAIEGAHAFIKETGNAADNLLELRKAAKVQGFCLLYSTLTHLTRIDEPNSQKELATFSYGMKMIKDAVFHPRGKGISSEGIKFINSAYSVQNEMLPVLIDVKHASLFSRKEFYKFRKDNPGLVKINGTHFKEIPIIASHCGVTGISWDKFADEVLSAEKEGGAVALRIARPKAGNNPRMAWFNPWSINLFDEDIQYIIKSGGLIGISIDQRILGFEPRLGKLLGKTETLFGEEYMSKEEFDMLGVDVDELPERMAVHEAKEEQASELAKELFGIGEQEFNKRLHTWYFCYNLLHILKISFTHYTGQGLNAQDAMDKAWEHVCIGSDFDGLIDPVNSFRNITEWSDFEKKLNKHLAGARDFYVSIRNNISLPIEGKKGITLYIKQLMFENGKRFIKNWLSNKITTPASGNGIPRGEVLPVKNNSRKKKKASARV
jgi:microsomal dipeptidase-like Zn-dependent dipeptidase